ncbi:hypothetical protein [Arthrobacter sp. H35-D1]|uniref:hypothetical protein n=1 Tax=Arthrobacter sp. H35-D1 TaxID=3046202 RepID=UPI0024BBDD21|nr:hypothetical protein [Arthrobacter sp. H35-D1]MDJ0312894.1 hypothetical protein [Arthrobacter sp. H35-D1]
MNTPTETNPAEDIGSPHGSSSPTAPEYSMRVGTMVWGAVVLVLGVLLIIARQSGLVLDAGQTAMWLLLGTGVAMVAGGIVHLLRRK